MILEDLNILLGKDNFTDEVLNIYIRKAIATIKNYLNSDTYDSKYIETNFADAIIELTYHSCIGKGKENIANEKFGSTSKSYKITNSVKDLLPLPTFGVLG